MKMESFQTETIVRNNTTSESSFKIKATEKTFNILSSQLYSDKIRAVIRELSTNAYDSHVMAGKTDIPFELHLPSMMEPHFSIRDFGIGLSVSDVLTLYSTYFESIKTNSDDYIGSLGLGSKSPFSYTRMFSVTSWFDGAKSIYSAFISENGRPSIALLHQEPSDEPNGLEVKFAVESKDFREFISKAASVLYYFNLKPIILGCSGFSYPTVAYKLIGNRWKLRDRNYYSGYSNGPIVIQGNIEYPLDNKNSFGLDKEFHFLLSTSFEIHFDIGELNFSASRESLHYDTRTITNLKKRFEDIYIEVRDLIKKEFDEKTSLWEVKKLYGEMYHHNALGTFFRNGLTIEWKGQKISTDTFSFIVSEFPNIDFYANHNERYRSFKKIESTGWKLNPAEKANRDLQMQFTINPSHRIGFFVNDVRNGFQSRIEEYRKSKNIDDVFVLVKKETSTEEDFQADVKKLFKELDYNAFMLVSQLPKKERVVRKIDGYRLCSSQHSPKHGAMSVYEAVANVDQDKGGIYVELAYGKAQYNDGTIFNIQPHTTFARSAGIITPDQFVYGFTKSKLPDGPQWKNLFDSIRDYVTTKYQIASTDFGDLYRISKAYKFNKIKAFLDHPKMAELQDTSTLKRFAQSFGNLSHALVLMNHKDMLKSIGFETAPSSSKLENLFHSMMEVYTLFDHIDGDLCKESILVSDLFEYIKNVDRRTQVRENK